MKDFLLDVFCLVCAFIMDHLGMLVVCAVLIFFIWCCMKAASYADKKW